MDGPVHSVSLLPDLGPVHCKAITNRENRRHAGTLSDPFAHSGSVRNGGMGQLPAIQAKHTENFMLSLRTSIRANLSLSGRGD